MSPFKSSQESAPLKTGSVQAPQTLDASSRLLLASLPLLSLLLFAPDYLIGELPSPDVTLIRIVLACVSSIFIYYALNPEGAWPERFTPRMAMLGVVAFILVYSIAFIFVTFYQYWSFGSFGRDTSIQAQSFWSTLFVGKLSYTSLEGYHFGYHASPSLFLFSPLFALYPHSVTLLAMRVPLIAMSAIPLFKILERNLPPFEAMVLSWAYLAYAPIVHQFVGDFYDLHFFPLLILLAFYFFEVERFWLFFLFFFSAMLLREELVLLGPAFAFYSHIKKRSLRWLLPTLIASIIWALIAFRLFIPYFSHQGYKQHQYTTQALHELAISKVLSFENVKYLVKIHQPLVIVLPYFSSIWLIAAPFIAGILITTKAYAKSFFTHYQLTAIPLLFLSASLGISSVARRLYGRAKPTFIRGVTLALSVLVLTLCLNQTYHTFFKRLDYIFTPFSVKYPEDGVDKADVPLPHGYTKTLHEVTASLPPDAKLVVPSYLTPYLANRLYLKDWIDENVLSSAEYIVIDRNAQNLYTRRDLNEQADRLGLENFDLIFEENGVELYRAKRLVYGENLNQKAQL